MLNNIDDMEIISNFCGFRFTNTWYHTMIAVDKIEQMNLSFHCNLIDGSYYSMIRSHKGIVTDWKASNRLDAYYFAILSFCKLERLNYIN